jgi:sodium/pantothenate symporter
MNHGFLFSFSTWPLLAVGSSNAALVTFLIYTLAVFGLAALSNQLLKSKSFLSEYFLGSRSLGVWAFALTFAATSASGGSFTGFPSKIYTHGWVLGLWIGSYIVVPICAMGLLGKRINQVSRISGSITVPDVIRDRFHSAKFGLLSVLLIVFFMSFNLVAQFKSGALILKTLLSGVNVFDNSAVAMSKFTAGIEFFGGVDPQYLICLFAFGLAVIVYTTYGGFRAVVWTDVMQGIVMVIGVMIMLPLAISAAGGLESATRDMAKMTPPMRVKATMTLVPSNSEERDFSSETWLALDPEDKQSRRLFRLTKTVIFPEGTSSLDDVDVLEITSPHEIDRLIDGEGGFKKVPLNTSLTLSNLKTEPYHYGKGLKGVYVTGPGPSPTDHGGFLPLSLAVSFFFMWAISGAGQPSSMVRLMAFNSSQTLRRSIFTVALYYSMIYFPLVIIFCCARVVMPGMDAESDRIMPAMAVLLTENIGLGWLAGLLVAAPFAAVMSTVDSFLLMISSALVRDIYQRNINPEAEERTLKYMSYLCTLVVGTAAMLGAVNPPQFLQDIIVYTGSGLAACFLAPMVFALYWPRANVQGCMAGMLAGFGAHLSLYVGGMFVNGSFYKPYLLYNFNPIIVGLFVSFTTVFFVTQMTPPPPAELVRKYFYKQKT